MKHNHIKSFLLPEEKKNFSRPMGGGHGLGAPLDPPQLWIINTKQHGTTILSEKCAVQFTIINLLCVPLTLAAFAALRSAAANVWRILIMVRDLLLQFCVKFPRRRPFLLLTHASDVGMNSMPALFIFMMNSWYCSDITIFCLICCPGSIDHEGYINLY